MTRPRPNSPPRLGEPSINIYEEQRKLKEADLEKLSFTSGQNSTYIMDRNSGHGPYKALMGRRPSHMQDSGHTKFGGNDNQHMVRSTNIDNNSTYMVNSGTFQQGYRSERPQ